MIMSLVEWYGSREILVTGVTSEIGRILLEKLLRTLPNTIIYAIVRSRDGLTKDERVKKIFSSPGFERLRQQNSKAIDRVKIFEGNLLYSNLGLSPEDSAELKNIEIVFHAAGSIDYVYEFCQTALPKLRVLAAATDLIAPKKSNDSARENYESLEGIPLVILRLPTIGPALNEPMPGFVEILRGPTALMIGAGFALGRNDLPAEILPVDLAVNALIMSAWKRGISDKNNKPTIYNSPNLGCTWGELIEKGKLAHQKFPYPTFGIRGMTSIALLHWLIVFFFEWLPSALCDLILTVCGAKPRCINEYEKVRKALQSLEIITTKPLTIDRSTIRQLDDNLTAEDREKYPINCDIDIEAYVLCAAASAKKYCIDDDNVKIIGNLKKLLIAFGIAIFIYIFMISCT